MHHQWGFANTPKDFRPDDFVVSPEGTTKKGEVTEFYEGDGRKLHALVEELKKAVKVRAVFLYGHSQGSFFSLQYAGEYPEEVDGVVAHASGLWRSSPVGKKGHRQAIVLMHGTQDPVVPYAQSVGGYEALKEAGYPMARLRSLEGWNHWPTDNNGVVPHTGQQLAWVEGMTTKDPDRLEACFAFLSKVEADGVAEHDFAGLWSLASRIAALEEAPADLKAKATKAKERVEALAAAHVQALELPEKLAFAKADWVGHLPLFLRGFRDLPAREELAKRLEAVSKEHDEEGGEHYWKWRAAAEKGKKADAFEEGLAAIETGFLSAYAADLALREDLKAARKDAKALKLSKGVLKRYDAVFEDFEKSLADGWKSFESVNRKSGTD
jgi:pimeloyl-ACP methyl ester carboxylesterase